MTTDTMIQVSRESSTDVRANLDPAEHADRERGRTPSELALDAWETDGGRVLVFRGDPERCDPRVDRSG